ncbi:MAG: alpha/beta hydrolase [Candidatus Bathyarchaeota archaeon]|nr:alpha/beta hydrolase [Candidatus Bathyarchaeota archaeon]
MSEKTLQLAGYKCQSLLHKADGVPVVLLHGYSYTVDVWQRIGTTQLFAEKKIPFLALDMPYGAKSSCQPKTQDVDANVAVVQAAVEMFFGSHAPVILGASLGGKIALNYAAKYPVKGLFLVAPASALDSTLAKSYSQFSFPVRIVWGSEDNLVQGEDMRTLAGKLSHAKLFTYQDAGHSAYLAEPKRFNREVLELYAAAEQL